METEEKKKRLNELVEKGLAKLKRKELEEAKMLNVELALNFEREIQRIKNKGVAS